MISSWEAFIAQEQCKEYYKKIESFLDEEYQLKTIYPQRNDILNCFEYTPLDKIKVVILGQDPYHQPNQAHGLSFSVKYGVKVPPSLNNIYKELYNDLGYTAISHGNLESWAKQGVLLLNNVLTVEYNKPNSHKDIGWESFTDEVFRVLNNQDQPIVFILWGKHAAKKKVLLNNPKHLIIQGCHPSPLSAYHGFFGSKPFSKTNEYLVNNNVEPINWQIEDESCLKI